MAKTKILLTLLLALLALSACNNDDGEIVYMLPESKSIQLNEAQK